MSDEPCCDRCVRTRDGRLWMRCIRCAVIAVELARIEHIPAPSLPADHTTTSEENRP